MTEGPCFFLAVGWKPASAPRSHQHFTTRMFAVKTRLTGDFLAAIRWDRIHIT